MSDNPIIDFSDYRYFTILDARGHAELAKFEDETEALDLIRNHCREKLGAEKVLWPLGSINSSDPGCLYLTIQICFWLYTCFFIPFSLWHLAHWLQLPQRELSLLICGEGFAMVTAAVTLFFLYRFSCRKVREKEKVNPDYDCVLSREEQKLYVKERNGEFEPIPWEQVNVREDYRVTGGRSNARIYHVLLSSLNREVIHFHDCEKEECKEVIRLFEQFMDPTQPIPDIPRLEPFRELDRVTRAYDSKMNRPKDLWKNLSDEQIQELWHAPNKFKGERGFEALSTVQEDRVQKRELKQNWIYITSVILFTFLFGSCVDGGTIYENGVKTYAELSPGFDHWSDKCCFIAGVILELFTLYLMLLPIGIIAGFGVLMGIESYQKSE